MSSVGGERWTIQPPVPTRNSIGTVKVLTMPCFKVANAQLQNVNAKYAISLWTIEALCGRPRPDYRTLRPGKASREQRSGGAAFVVVMQTADVREWDDRAARWRLGPRGTGASLSNER